MASQINLTEKGELLISGAFLANKFLAAGIKLKEQGRIVNGGKVFVFLPDMPAQERLVQKVLRDKS